MRALKSGAFLVFLVAMCAIHANADETSTFSGTITQAPSGNLFGVANDDFVQGNIDYPVVVGSVYNGTVNNFTIVFNIGAAVYTQVVASTGNPGSVTLSDGLITDIEVTFPPTPCGIAGVPACPSLTLTQASFFTSPMDCQLDQVCGTLNFADSQPQLTPELSTFWLLAAGLLGLFFCRSKIAARA